MTEIDRTERIGTNEPQVLRKLGAWLDGSDDIDDGAEEVVRHIVTYPEHHRRETSAIVAEELTFGRLLEAFESDRPKTWGYPADTWDTARRIGELVTRSVLGEKEAIVYVLSEEGRSDEEIAEMLNHSTADVAAIHHRVDQRIDRARNTVELVDGRSR
ncbi:MAG: hypothetical protein ABEJ28_03370 [Salinigranum sp.]